MKVKLLLYLINEDVRVLNLVIRWKWVFSFTPRPLYLRGWSPQYLLYRRLGGPQSRFGRY
jgi:hypothetical protein